MTNVIEAALGRLSARQQERVRVAHASFEEGLLTSSELVDVVTNVILAGNATGYALGALSVRRLVEQQVGAVEVTRPAPNPQADEGRVRGALATVLASQQDTAMQLARIADNEPKQAAARGSADVIAESDHVDGWERSLNADACDLCRWWAAESHKFAPHAKMPRHTGCACTQTPITTKEKTA